MTKKKKKKLELREKEMELKYGVQQTLANQGIDQRGNIAAGWGGVASSALDAAGKIASAASGTGLAANAAGAVKGAGGGGGRTAGKSNERGENERPEPDGSMGKPVLFIVFIAIVLKLLKVW